MYLYPSQKLQVTKHEHGGVTYKYLPHSELTKAYFKYIFFPILSPILGYFASKRDVGKYLDDITDTEIAGLDWSDYPDFVDAYISKAVWRSSLTPLTDEQIDQLNERHSDYVYEVVQNNLY
jgi:hypothetical protein